MWAVFVRHLFLMLFWLWIFQYNYIWNVAFVFTYVYTYVHITYTHVCTSVRVYVYDLCMCVCVCTCVTAVLDIPSCQEPSSSSLSHDIFLQACDKLIMSFILLWNRSTPFTKDIRSHLVKYLSLIQQPPSRTQVCWEETLDHATFHKGWTLFWLSQLSFLAFW